MIEHLYSTPVYSNFCNDYQVLNYHIDKKINKVKFSYKSDWGRTHLLSTDFQEDNINVLKYLKLDKIIKEIDYHVKIYCSEIGREYKKYELQSWFSKFTPGDYAQIHNHTCVDISGVYYYKTNGVDGDFFFESPNPHLSTSHMFGHLGRRWEYKPESGKILLFPGWLNHGVKTNETKDERISLSFNIIFPRA